MRPFETSDVVFIETLKAKHATVKTQLAAAGRAQDAHPVAEIAAEREKADKAFAELLRVADWLDALAAERARPWWRRLTGWSSELAGGLPRGVAFRIAEMKAAMATEEATRPEKDGQ